MPQVRINTQSREERRDQCANERGKWRGPESGTREFKLLRRVMSETNINWRSLRVSCPTFACIVTITALKHVHPTNNLVCLDLERKINNDSTLDWSKHCIQLSVTRWASVFLKRPSCLSASFGNSIICQESGFALIIHSQRLRRKATFPHYANKTFSTSGGFMKKIQVATFSKLTLPIEGWWQIKSALSQPPVRGWNMGGRSTAQEKKQSSKLEMLFHASLISCFAHAIKNSKQKRLTSPSAHPDAHTASLGHAARRRIAPALYGAAIISSHKISTETWRHQKWFNSIWGKKP